MLIMQHNNVINIYLNNILLFIVFFFPLAIILGSSAINISVALICVITLLKFFKDIEKYITKNSLLIYLFFLFLYIFVNQIFKFNSFELFLKYRSKAKAPPPAPLLRAHRYRTFTMAADNGLLAPLAMFIIAGAYYFLSAQRIINEDFMDHSVRQMVGLMYL